MQLRPYQEAAVASIYDYFRSRSGNPIIVLPTASGKSVVIAHLLRSIFNSYSGQRIIIASHVREIIDQNHQKLISIWPTAPAGIYAASLDRRDIAPITFVSIQTTAKRHKEFGHIDLLLIDECHLVGTHENTQYLQFIAGLKTVNPKLKVIGFTATPFRLGLGMLTEGDIFDDICFDLSERHAFNRLVAEGYLAPLVTKHTVTQLDVSEVKKVGGEFVAKELQAAVDRTPITAAAIQETVALAAGRKHWLIFAAGLEHATHIADMLTLMDVPAARIDGEMSMADRSRTIADFKSGKIKAVVNYGVLTTGFDFPNIDLIVMLRPTSSPGLWVQMIGRGCRVAPGKTNCLVLDFGGNTRRLGPINDPIIPKKKGAKANGSAPVKLCPDCSTYSHASSRVCEQCGHEFPRIIKIEAMASNDNVIADDAPIVLDFDVDEVYYRRHTKVNRPDSLCVEYYCGLRRFREWVCFEHSGYARIKANAWWVERAKEPPPATVEEALTRLKEIVTPRAIRVWANTKHPEILAHYW